MAKSKAKPKRKSNRGGARPNSGRKPKAVTEVKAALIAALAPSIDSPSKAPIDAQNDAAEYAFRLFERTMRDEAQAPLDLRLDCAREVLNRVWGKPAQSVKHSGDDDSPIKVIVEYADAQARLAPPASGTEEDTRGIETF